MMPAFLITFREVIEASLIVATILGILVKLNQTKGIRTVWIATLSATMLCVTLLVASSLFGLKIQTVFNGKIQQATEGVLLMISAIFITWAVFFLHTYFSIYKVKLLQKVKNTIENEEKKGLFILVFAAVFREGFEVVLFLTTIYFTSTPFKIFQGIGIGIITGILISFALFSATIKIPIRNAFKITSALLILFAGGMLAKGIQEFGEFGAIPSTIKFSLPFIPSHSFVADIIQSIFGITKHMDLIQIMLYIGYVVFMGWWVFFRKSVKINFK